MANWRTTPEMELGVPSFSFRIGSIPVELQGLALVVPAFAARGRSDPLEQCVWIVLVVLSVLWHELGHALAMRSRRFRSSIVLHGLGGYARWPSGAYPTVRERIWVTLAGPGAGLLLGGAVWLASRPYLADLPELAAVAVRDLLWINVAWSLLNLAPLLPLDGSHLLDELAELATGEHQPRWVGLVSLLVGGVGAFWAASHGWSFASFFALVGAMQGWSRWTGARLFPAMARAR
jgi:Zn-dependent protease